MFRIDGNSNLKTSSRDVEIENSGSKKRTRGDYSTQDKSSLVSAEEIRRKIQKQGFSLLTAEGKDVENNSFLYSLKVVMDKVQRVESTGDEVEKWVNDLRIKAIKCGFTKNDNIHLYMYGEEDGHGNAKIEAFHKEIKYVLGKYALKIMKYDPDNEVVNEVKTVLGIDCNRIDELNTIYMFDNGNHRYNPLVKIERSWNLQLRRFQKEEDLAELTERINNACEKESFKIGAILVRKKSQNIFHRVGKGLGRRKKMGKFK